MLRKLKFQAKKWFPYKKRVGVVSLSLVADT